MNCPRAVLPPFSPAGFQRLSAKWDKMTPAEKEPFEKLALSRQAQLHAEESPEEEEAAGELVRSEAAHTGPWGCGCGSLPLTAERMAAPAYSKSFSDRLGVWVDELEETIRHDSNPLPYAVTSHDCPCRPGSPWCLKA